MDKGDSDDLILSLENVEATERLGAALANVLQDGMLVLLQGDLGVGKTSLVRGVLRALGHQGAVKSPTYTLLEEYTLTGKEVIHFDLYRLTDPEELDLIGIRDYFNRKACCFVEWPERGKGYLPLEDLTIQISHRANGREVRISAVSDSGRKITGYIKTASCLEPD